MKNAPPISTSLYHFINCLRLPSSHLLSAHVASRLLLEAMSPADRLALTRWMANGANGPMD